MDKNAEIDAKTARVVEMLTAQNLGGALIGSQHNFSWLTAGGTNGIDLSREAGGGALLVRRDGKRYVLANRIEMPRLLTEELGGAEFEPIEFAWEEEKACSTFLADRATDLLAPGSVLGSDIPGASPIETELARCRYRLTSSEIERLRSLAGEASTAIGRLAGELQPGESERAVARRVTDALATCNIHSVVTLVAADERIRKYRHPVPTDCRWTKTLMIVVCARRGGLIASFTRIVCKGPVPDELRRRTRAAAHVNAQLLSATRPGVSGADLFKIAAQTYAATGYEHEEHLHHQGGATGYRTRDWVAHPRCEERVEINQAFAWNPSISGTKVEETCLAFADGVETITASPEWPQLLVRVDGHEYAAPDVMQI